MIKNQTPEDEMNNTSINMPSEIKRSTIFNQLFNKIILSFPKRKHPKKKLNFDFPEFWNNVDVKINEQKYIVIRMICPKYKSDYYTGLEGSQNSGVYCCVEKKLRDMELIVKFPKSKSEYYRELKIYEDLKFSKYIIKLIATEIKFKNKYYAAFVTPKLNSIQYSHIVFARRDTKEFKMQYENFKLLMKDLIKANYFLGDVRKGNFGFDVQENIWKVFDIGIAFKIPQTQKEFDEIWINFTKENLANLRKEPFQRSVKFALKYPHLAAYRFNIHGDRFSGNIETACGLPINICGYLSLQKEFSEKWYTDFEDKNIFLSKETIEMKYILSMQKSFEDDTKDNSQKNCMKKADYHSLEYFPKYFPIQRLNSNEVYTIDVKII